MRKVLAVAAIVAASVVVVGCLETKQDYTLNPDGSGKMLVELAMSQMPFGFGQPDPQADPDLDAKRFVKQVLDGSSGVDAWADVAYARTDDGRTKFTGTAYFKDFSQVKLQSGSMSGFSLAKDDTGGLVLTVQIAKPGQPEPPEQAAPAAPPPALTDEQVAEQVAKQRAQYQQMRPMMAMTFGAMKINLSFRLPGTLAEVNGFQKEPSGAVRFVLDGVKVLQAMDQMMTDDALLGQAVRSGGGPPLGGGFKMDDVFGEKLLGIKGPLRARATGPFTALFAYESEVKAAKAAYPKMIERLGLDKLPAAPPGPTMPPGFGLPGGGRTKGQQPPSE